MMEIAAAISMAASAAKAIKGAIENGREVADMVEVFGRFFDAKDEIAEHSMKAGTKSGAAKLFSGRSVEAEALQVTAAKHRVKAMEKELYEYLLYTGQQQFYDDMMRERREIRQRRLMAAKAAAERKAFIIDMIALIVGGIFSAGIVIGLIMLFNYK